MGKIILKYALLLAIIWSLIIFGLCCMPGNYIPTTNWLELLSFDKFVHAFIFCVLTALWFIVLIKRQKVNAISIAFVMLLCVLFGGVIEIMQATVFTNRSADWFDFIANSFGCFIAWFVFYKWSFFSKQIN